MATNYRVPVLEKFEWQPAVISLGDTTPPVSPARGDRYVVGSGATGAWNGYDNYIAYCCNATGPVWAFDNPLEGTILWVKDEDCYYTWDGTQWIQNAMSGYSGYSGTSGYSGYSGESGYSGYSGQSGYSGESGYSGYSGESGYSGYSGESGYSGYSGVSGYSGYSGESGYSGYSGESGYSGYSGESGYSGYSGTSGYSGYSGVSGYSGYSGFSGYSGPGACYDTDFFCLIIGADNCGSTTCY